MTRERRIEERLRDEGIIGGRFSDDEPPHMLYHEQACSVCTSHGHASVDCPHRFGGSNYNRISNPDGV